jgi:hypothetical protein
MGLFRKKEATTPTQEPQLWSLCWMWRTGGSYVEVNVYVQKIEGKFISRDGRAFDNCKPYDGILPEPFEKMREKLK